MKEHSSKKFPFFYINNFFFLFFIDIYENSVCRKRKQEVSRDFFCVSFSSSTKKKAKILLEMRRSNRVQQKAPWGVVDPQT